MAQDGDQRLQETSLSRTTVFSGRLLTVHDDEVRLPGGASSRREVVEHPGAVAIVARDEQDRVVLVRQWRHAVGRALWELPAGSLDHGGETPAQAAARELAEETGLRAQSWADLGSAPLTPGYSTEMMHFFAALELEEGEPAAEADELLDVGRYDREEVSALHRRGEIDVKTIAGLALVGWPLKATGGLPGG